MVRQLFKGGEYSKEETIVFLLFVGIHNLNCCRMVCTDIKQSIYHVSTYVYKKDYHKYNLELKLKVLNQAKKSGTLLYKVRQLFKGGNYSREETIK